MLKPIFTTDSGTIGVLTKGSKGLTGKYLKDPNLLEELMSYEGHELCRRTE